MWLLIENFQKRAAARVIAVYGQPRLYFFIKFTHSKYSQQNNVSATKSHVQLNRPFALPSAVCWKHRCWLPASSFSLLPFENKFWFLIAACFWIANEVCVNKTTLFRKIKIFRSPSHSAQHIRVKSGDTCFTHNWILFERGSQNGVFVIYVRIINRKQVSYSS